MFLFLAFALIVTLGLWIRQLSERVEETSAQLRVESRRGDDLSSQVALLLRRLDPVKPQPPVPIIAVPPKLPVQEVEPPPAPTPKPPIVQPSPPPLPKREPLPVPEEKFAFASMAQETGGWEALIGGNLLNKLGALILVIGIALFLSYSFAHMGPVGRTCTGLGISLALLGSGIRTERILRYKVFARGLMAAGWASLYFTAYASYSLPAAKIITSPAVGIGMMLLVASGMVLHSLRYKVQSLTALAYGCIFAALALSAMNTFVAIALAPLAASMLYLARRFQWHGLALFAAAATYATFLSRPSAGATLLAIQSMLLLFWVLFEAFDLLRAFSRQRAPVLEQALFGVNAIAGLGASGAIWYRMGPGSMWQFCAAASLLYLASTWVRFLLSSGSLYEFTLAISALMMGLTIFAHVQGIWIGLGMMLEAELLFLAGLYLRLRWSRVLSLLAFAASLLQLTTNLGTTLIHGVSVDQWAPPLAVLAGILYVNRFLARNAVYFGYLASGFVALILGFELPWRFAGLAWLVCGAILFELGTRKKLLDLRLQGYSLALLGAGGTAFSYLDPLRIHNAWAYAGGAILSIAVAIRATHWLGTLPELERRGLRVGGAAGSVVLGGLLMTRLAPEPYWGLAVLGISLLFLELALHRLPAEIWLPAVGLNLVGLSRLVFEHAFEIQKHPAKSVWIAFTGAAFAYYWLTARLSRDAEQDCTPVRIAAPWFAPVLALTGLWMVLPDTFVPAAFGTLAWLSVEAGFLLEDSNLIFNGQCLSLIALVPVFFAGVAGAPRVASGAILSVLHYYLWYRNRRQSFAFLHGWTAAVTVTVLIALESPLYWLALWALSGAVLATAGSLLSLRDLRWQAAALAIAATVASFSEGAPVWQQAAIVAWFLLSVVLDKLWGSPGYVDDVVPRSVRGPAYAQLEPGRHRSAGARFLPARESAATYRTLSPAPVHSQGLLL